LNYIKTKFGLLDKENKEDWIPIYEKYIDLNSIGKVASLLGINHKTVRSIFKKHGFLNIRGGGNIKTNLGVVSKKDINFWVKYYTMYLEDKNTNRVEDLLGISYTTIYRVFSDLDLELIPNQDRYSHILEKIKETNLKKYGYSVAAKNNEIRNKIRETHLGKSNLEKVKARNKLICTLRNKYGDDVDWISKSCEFKNKIKKSLRDRAWIFWQEYLSSNNYKMIENYQGVFHITEQGKKYIKYNFVHEDCGRKFQSYFQKDYLKCPFCYSTPSKLEMSLFKYVYDLLLENKYTCINKTKSLIPPYEIDIFIPELNIGFEYNGTYWHSILNKEDKNYHKDKTELALSKGIKLYHIWEHDNEEIVKSIICGVLNKTENKISARKCEVREVKTKDRREFFDGNHLHGDVGAKSALGLYYDNELISCISFRKHKEGIEIARFASKLHCSIRGGFSKLLKHSISKLRELGYSKIITYCDRDWTPDYKDSVYYKNGFNFVGDSGCILRYYDSINNRTYPRETFQKHKLKGLFEDYNFDNVDEFLQGKRIYGFYNSGNWKFELLI